MGNFTSQIGEFGFWEEHTTAEKLLALPLTNFGVANISQSEEFQQWKRHTSVQQVINILLHRDYFQTVQLKTKQLAYVFVALTQVVDKTDPESPISKNRQDLVQFTDQSIAQIFYEVINKYLDSTKNINPHVGPMLAHTQKKRVGSFFFSLGWDKLLEKEKQLIKERILVREPALVEHYQMIFNYIDPEIDSFLYPYINDITRHGKTKQKAWIALASFGKLEDKDRILKMLEKAKGGPLCTGEPKNAQLRCYTALSVVTKFPSHSYFHCITDLFHETISQQEQFVNSSPSNKYTWSTVAIEKALKLLFKAIVTYKTIEAREVILEFVTKPYDPSIVAWRKFRTQMLGWLGEALSEIQDTDCFFVKLMQEVAQSGRMSLPLLKRIHEYDPDLALSWMTSLNHPIVAPETEEDEVLTYMAADGTTPQSERLQWVLERLVEKNPPNLLDVICYYVNHIHHSTCAVSCAFAFQFQEHPLIKDALLAQLRKPKNQERVIYELVKTLLEFKVPEIDHEVESIIRTRMQNEKGFDRHGTCIRMLGAKPRK